MKKTLGTALITGATSGIGESYARALAAEGYDLLLTGRRADVIEKLAGEIRTGNHVSVEVLLGDLAESSVLEAIINRIQDLEVKDTPVTMLINNAGFGSIQGFFKDDFESQRKMLRVHCEATIELIHVVSKGMMARRGGAIINVSSLGSFMPAPNSEMYMSTKAFLNMFSESIYLSLKPFHIKVQCLCPGWTKTDFHSRPGAAKGPKGNRGLMRWMKADEVVNISLKALEKEKVIVIPGLHNKIIKLIVTFLPRSIYNRQIKNRLRKIEKM